MEYEIKNLLLTPAQNNPWKHWICEDFFSQQHLNEFLNLFKNYVPQPDVIKRNKEKKLLSDKILFPDFYWFEEGRHSCFCNVTQKMISKFAFLREISDIFLKEEIIKHFCEHRGDDRIRNGYLRIQIIRDMPGYKIASHPDSKSKLLTFQCYFPTTTNESIGTQLYNKEGELVNEITYKQNSSYWFIPVQEGDVTLHGFCNREILHNRDSIMINYMSDQFNAANGVKECFRI